MSGEGQKLKCEQCGVEFIADWSDEEALAESRELFGDVPEKDLAVVCDVCWTKLGFGSE